ncbi:MAG: hypothetical protein E7319_00300 [Clostridiales bacterium]|nr:hypothetical protein [Clostridiales bacterium]
MQNFDEERGRTDIEADNLTLSPVLLMFLPLIGSAFYFIRQQVNYSCIFFISLRPHQTPERDETVSGNQTVERRKSPEEMTRKRTQAFILLRFEVRRRCRKSCQNPKKFIKRSFLAA